VGLSSQNRLKLSNTVSLTALSITVVVQRTTGISFNGQYNTRWTPDKLKPIAALHRLLHSSLRLGLVKLWEQAAAGPLARKPAEGEQFIQRPVIHLQSPSPPALE
jgi:hypothetical protein